MCFQPAGWASAGGVGGAVPDSLVFAIQGLAESCPEEELVLLYGPLVTVQKTLFSGAVLELRLPAALAVEEVLRSPANGVLVKSARVIADALIGKWDMSESCPYWNPWTNAID